MATMGFREYARHRGCTLRAVQKAIKAGRIKLVGPKQIDPVQADRDWVENTDPAKQSVMHSTGPSTADDVQTSAPKRDAALAREEDDDELPPALPAGVPEDPTTKEYRESRTAREKLRLAKEQREFDIEGGKLLPLEDAQRVAFTAFRQLRDAILHVPARVKDAMAAETNPDVIEQLLETELGAALGSFDPAAVLNEQADPDDDDQEAAQ